MSIDLSDPAAVLDAAADELLLHGWSQGAYGEDDEPKCMEGVLCYIMSGSITHCHRIRRAYSNPVMWRCLGLLGMDGIGNVISWNDQPERTQDEVIEALRHAAKYHREATQVEPEETR